MSEKKKISNGNADMLWSQEAQAAVPVTQGHNSIKLYFDVICYRKKPNGLWTAPEPPRLNYSPDI